MPDPTIPWAPGEVADYASLVVSTLMVAAFPVAYGLLANLRDRLALVVFLATSATALAFSLTAILWPLSHYGVELPVEVGHWLARTVYLTVGLGKLLLLLTFLRERRHAE